MSSLCNNPNLELVFNKTEDDGDGATRHLPVQVVEDGNQFASGWGWFIGHELACEDPDGWEYCVDIDWGMSSDDVDRVASWIAAWLEDTSPELVASIRKKLEWFREITKAFNPEL